MSNARQQATQGVGEAAVELRMAQMVPDTCSEGPFRRFALWVQGCSLRCPGCCNPEMQDGAAGFPVRMDVLLARIAAQPRIEGITLLGGEPFEQPGALAVLCRGVRSAGLGVMAFSGYTLDTLARRAETAALLAECDVLVDGPYVDALACRHRRWIGSSNQTVHFLTDRYRACPEFERPGQSVHITYEGERVRLSGFPGMLPSRSIFEGNPSDGGNSRLVAPAVLVDQYSGGYEPAAVRT